MTITVDASVFVTVGINIVVVIFSTGVLWAKVSRLEKDVTKLMDAFEGFK